jgi:hypothetical protein
MVVKWVKKVILEVPNVPVVTRVKRVLVTMAIAKHVRTVDFVNPMAILLILVLSVAWDTIKKNWAKRLAYPAFLARMKMILDRPNVKIARKDNTKMYLATKPVWFAKLANT